MEFLATYWAPILVSAVLVFLASSVLHMLIPIHKGDFKKLPKEEEVLDSLRNLGVSRGQYMFPCAGSMKDMCTPEMTARYDKGPVGYMTVLRNGPPSMGKSLVQWFVFCLVVGVFTAYVGHLGLLPGANYHAVFRLTGTVAILGYAVSCLVDSIWKGQSWVVTLKFVFDGLVYGLVTAGTFGWLWPAAV